jgi:hypothetical protein
VIDLLAHLDRFERHLLLHLVGAVCLTVFAALHLWPPHR